MTDMVAKSRGSFIHRGSQEVGTVVHTLFISKAPSGRVVKAYSERILLLSCFLFSFSAMHLSAIDRRDLDEADAEWINLCDSCTNNSGVCAPISHDICGDDPAHVILPSIRLARIFTVSYVVLGSCVLCSVMAYLSIIFSEIDETTSSKDLKEWWKFYQWPMHFAMILLCVGLAFFGSCMELSARILFIDIKNIERAESFVWKELRAFNAVYAIVGVLAVYMLIAHVVVNRKSSLLRKDGGRGDTIKMLDIESGTVAKEKGAKEEEARHHAEIDSIGM